MDITANKHTNLPQTLHLYGCGCIDCQPRLTRVAPLETMFPGWGPRLL